MGSEVKFHQFQDNPRTITDRKKRELEKSIRQFGDISGIVHELNSDEIITGNQRMKAIGFTKKDIVILQEFNPPLSDGTEKVGYIEKDGVRLNYRAVRLSEDQAAVASLSANMMGGRFDESKFKRFSDAVLEKCGFQKFEKSDDVNNRLIRKSQIILVTIGVFQVKVSADAYQRYCSYLKSKYGNGNLLDLFLKDIGFYEGV